VCRGKWVSKSEDEEYEGEWKHDLKEGVGTWKHEDGEA
jgi:hypothetical protein